MKCKLVILECNSQSHPAICFNLNLARCETRVVFDENEALNLLEIAHQTGVVLDCLLVNNPASIRMMTHIVERGARIGAGIPIVFVDQSETLEEKVASLVRSFPSMHLYSSHPTNLTAFVMTLLAERPSLSDQNASSGTELQAVRR